MDNVMQPGERFTLASFTPNGKGFDCNIEYREKTATGSKVLAHRFVIYHPTFKGAQEWSRKTNRREADAILRRKGMVEVDGLPVPALQQMVQRGRAAQRLLTAIKGAR